MLCTPCLRRILFRPSISRISSRSRTTAAAQALAAGADLTSPRKIGVFPPLEAKAHDTLTDHQIQLLGSALMQSLRCWNNQPSRSEIIFYHEPSDKASNENLALLEAIYSNAKGHLAPFKFALDVRETLPSAETFQDLLYESRGTSFHMFLNPKYQNRHHIPSAAALLELLSKQPHLLWTPVVHYKVSPPPNNSPNAKPDATLFVGGDAVPDLLKLLDGWRTKQMGPQNLQILNHLVETQDFQSINQAKPRPRQKRARPKGGIRLDRLEMAK